MKPRLNSVWTRNSDGLRAVVDHSSVDRVGWTSIDGRSTGTTPMFLWRPRWTEESPNEHPVEEFLAELEKMSAEDREAYSRLLYAELHAIVGEVPPMRLLSDEGKED